MAKEIKNYLKSVKDITAPLNWKSSSDSPPTQLAYVTQPEIDMLVKANIHGSMNGKPNMGLVRKNDMHTYMAISYFSIFSIIF